MGFKTGTIGESSETSQSQTRRIYARCIVRSMIDVLAVSNKTVYVRHNHREVANYERHRTLDYPLVSQRICRRRIEYTPLHWRSDLLINRRDRAKRQRGQR